MSRPYGRSTAEVFPFAARHRVARPGLFAAKELAPYLATPLGPFLRELRHRSCTAILCQEYEFPRFDFCVATRRLHRLPVFGIFQGGDYQRWWAERLIRPRTVAASDGLIVSSEVEQARLAATYRADNVASIPNSIDLSVWRLRDRSEARRKLGIADTTRVVAWHGRIQVWKKGLDTLLDAWPRLTAELPDICLLLIGTGGDVADVRQHIVDRGLANVLWIDRFIHRREEIAGLLAAADAYAFPSRHEGFPVAPLEAMACGLPVVASEVSGVRELIRDEATSGGSLVPVDDVLALESELERLLADPEACRRRGMQARSRAESYGSNAVGSALRRVLIDDAT
jgi:starch synthase